ncbi:restriction endonuclease subunit S, partial [Candidatus Desantisbacteria bacterium]|nr:restriction endonuclease subunit S [Candidatus Desantisbacteria bacterium]
MTKKLCQTNWQTKKLGEICIVERGGSPRPIDSFITYTPEGINWIKIGDTKNITKYIFETKEKIKPEGAKCSRMVYEEDFILSNSMSFGRPYIMKTTGCIHDGWLVLRPKEKNIDTDFLYYLLVARLIFKQFNNLATGSTVRNLNINLVKSVQIPLPPLPTQQRIVKILDEVFEGISKAKENAEKNLQNARELFESYLQSVFVNQGDGWGEKKLGDCFKLKSGDNITSKMMMENGKFPAYGVNGIAGMYDKFNLSGSNIIIGRVGALCGNVRHIKKEIWLTDNAFKITDCKYDFDHAFLTYLLSFKNLRSYARQAAQPVISKLLQFPKSKDVQHSIVTKLNTLSAETKKLESIYTQKLSDLDEFKKSILQKAFSG